MTLNPDEKQLKSSLHGECQEAITKQDVRNRKRKVQSGDGVSDIRQRTGNTLFPSVVSEAETLHHPHHTTRMSNDTCQNIPTDRQTMERLTAVLTNNGTEVVKTWLDMLKRILTCWEQGYDYYSADSLQMSRTSASQTSHTSA